MIHRDNIPVFLSIAISMGLHLIVLPIVYSDAPSMAFSPPSKASHLETPRTEELDIQLGIDESNTSTLTWIGYKEYEEQRARFATVEQASMTVEVEVADQPPAFGQLRQIAAQFVALTKDFLDAMLQLEFTMPPRLATEPISVEPIETDRSDVPMKKPGEARPSDRDSDATSIVRISPENWKAGKPAAAQGIVLRPRRPSFTANQLVTNTSGNLVAVLYIDMRGKPIDVVILIGTGNGSIDRSIEASLYRWRASGDRIDELEDDETIKITIHITFSR